LFPRLGRHTLRLPADGPARARNGGPAGGSSADGLLSNLH
jgi:hypothetical protein